MPDVVYIPRMGIAPIDSFIAKVQFGNRDSLWCSLNLNSGSGHLFPVEFDRLGVLNRWKFPNIRGSLLGVLPLGSFESPKGRTSLI